MHTLPRDLKIEIFIRTSADSLYNLCISCTMFKSICTDKIFAMRAGVSLEVFNAGRFGLSPVERTKELLSDKESFIGNDEYAMISLCYANALVTGDDRTADHLISRGITPQYDDEARFEFAARTNNPDILKDLDITLMRRPYAIYAFRLACKYKHTKIINYVLSHGNYFVEYCQVLVETGDIKLIESTMETSGLCLGRWVIYKCMFVCGLDDYLRNVKRNDVRRMYKDLDSILLGEQPNYRYEDEVIERFVYTNDERLFGVLQHRPEYRRHRFMKILVHNKVSTLNKLYDRDPYISIGPDDYMYYFHQDTARVVYLRSYHDSDREHIIANCLHNGCISLARSLLMMRPLNRIDVVVAIEQLSVLEFIVLSLRDINITFTGGTAVSKYVDILYKLGVLKCIWTNDDPLLNGYKVCNNLPILSKYNVTDYPSVMRKLLMGIGMPLVKKV